MIRQLGFRTNMPYSKMKSERYTAFGGMNTKISTYLNGPTEFLNLKNIDFQTPGSLTKRWGSTQFFGQSLSSQVLGMFEYTKTTGDSYFLISAGGTLGVAYNDGFTSMFSGISARSTPVGGGATFFVNGVSNYTSSVPLGSSTNIDFTTMNNQCFFANGTGFFKTFPTTFIGNQLQFNLFGLPRFKFNGVSLVLANAVSPGQGAVGYYYFKFAWTNSYGLAGAPSLTYNGITASVDTSPEVFITASNTPAVLISIFGLTNSFLQPPGVDNLNSVGIGNFGFGSTAVAVFAAGPLSATLAVSNIENQNYALAGYLFRNVAGASQFYFSSSIDLVALQTSATPMVANILPWDWYKYYAYNPGASTTTFQLQANVGTGITIIPSFLETYNGRLYMAGSFLYQSTLFWSEVFEPEHLEADFSVDINATDGQPITALKAFNGSLFIFKEHSFFQQIGDDPTSAVIQMRSPEYGCLSNRAVANYSNNLVFLDSKGIIRFNGANIDILSNKLDPVFKRMNVQAAKQTACIVYDKQRNEVLCDIPVDGSSTNNLTVVYDIIADAWTTYDSYNPAISIQAYGGLNQQTVFMGGYSGLVSYFGPSFTTDNGMGYTCVAKSGFITDLGNSTAKQYRRLFMDTNPVGSSAVVNINLYQDFGASIVASGTLGQGDFQSRFDYGLQAKSLAVEFIMGSTYAMQLHGYTIEYRFLRKF